MKVRSFTACLAALVRKDFPKAFREGTATRETLCGSCDLCTGKEK